jgi:hypothetical protein
MSMKEVWKPRQLLGERSAGLRITKQMRSNAPDLLVQTISPTNYLDLV